MAVSPMRLTGLSNSIDTEQIIKDLMKVERVPVDKLYRDKQILEWKTDNYREINSKMLTLRSKSFDMQLESAYKKYSAVSSNDNIVSASATSSAALTSYTLNSISTLAKSGNVRTGDGQAISRSTSIASGSAISSAINTDTNNSFKISFDGAAFVDITLAPGKVYNGTTIGSTFTDLANEIQTKLDVAIGAGNVKVTFDSNNKIQFSANNYPLSDTPKTFVLQEGDSSDLLKTSLGFATDITTKQLSSATKKLNMDETIYDNLMQHRFGNTEDLGWVVNGSNSQTVNGTANMTSTVDFNSTNLSNYHITANENQLVTVTGGPLSEITSSINYKSSSASTTNVYVDGVEYTSVSGKTLSELADNEVLISDDGSGKVKLTFKNGLADGANVQIDSKNTYLAVTGKLQTELTDNEVLIEDDGTGKAKFTFKNQFNVSTKIDVDRHDFEFTTTVFDQDGNAIEKSLNIDSTVKSMNDVVGVINGTSDTGITAFYDESTDKMVFNSKYSGNNNESGNDILLSGNFLTGALSMTTNTDGDNASFSINGLATTRKNNSFTINGVTFDLKSTSATAISVTVSQDVNAVYDNIKSFVDAYNDTISLVNGKLTEDRDRDYTPLTSAQKEEMSDSEIELWETKAKTGLMRGDSILNRIVSDMRESFYDKVTSVSNENLDHLTELGITTSSNYLEKGKLVIDEAKLKNAISNDPESVMNFFSNESTATDSTQKYNESGIASRIYEDTSSLINELIAKAGQDSSLSVFDNSIIGKQLSSLTLSIEDYEDKLITKENNLYNRFSALESYISQMNTQSDWLGQQFSS